MKLFISSVQLEFAKERKALAQYIRKDPMMVIWRTGYASEGVCIVQDASRKGTSQSVVSVLCVIQYSQTELSSMEIDRLLGDSRLNGYLKRTPIALLDDGLMETMGERKYD